MVGGIHNAAFYRKQADEAKKEAQQRVAPGGARLAKLLNIDLK
jgi:hypothetical protein